MFSVCPSFHMGKLLIFQSAKQFNKHVHLLSSWGYSILFTIPGHWCVLCPNMCSHAAFACNLTYFNKKIVRALFRPTVSALMSEFMSALNICNLLDNSHLQMFESLYLCSTANIIVSVMLFWGMIKRLCGGFLHLYAVCSIFRLYAAFVRKNLSI